MESDGVVVRNAVPPMVDSSIEGMNDKFVTAANFKFLLRIHGLRFLHTTHRFESAFMVLVEIKRGSCEGLCGPQATSYP